MAAFGKKTSGKKPGVIPSKYGRTVRRKESDRFVSGKRESLEHTPGDNRYIRRDEDGRSASSSVFRQRNKRFVEESGPRLFTVGVSAKRSVGILSRTGGTTFSHDVFSSQAEYDRSVDSVVARIKSGEVKARQPDVD